MADLLTELKLPEKSFLDTYVKYCTEVTDAPPVYHLASGLTLIAAFCGSSVTFRGFGGRLTWPNLYALLIGPSGFRKSTALGIAEEIGTEASPGIVIRGEQSREAFLGLLQKQPSVLYPISEFSSALAHWAKEYNAGMKDIIVDLFDPHSVYERMTVGSGKITINRPAITILAGSTVDWLRSKLSEGDLRGGLMGRFLLIPATEKLPDRGLCEPDRTKKATLVSFLKEIGKMNNISAITTDIKAEFNSWLLKEQETIKRVADPDMAGFFHRVPGHALKLAILFHISDWQATDSHYEINQDDMHAAEVFSEWVLQETIKVAETGFTSSKTEMQLQSLFAKAGQRSEGMERGELLRKMHMTSRELDQLLDTAKARGQILEEHRKTIGRMGTWYLYQEPVANEVRINCEQSANEVVSEAEKVLRTKGVNKVPPDTTGPLD
jgi:hypothetical protein